VPPHTDKDGSKRVKLSDSGSTLTNGVSGSGASPPRSRSGSGSQHGSEPPPSREQRIGSTASIGADTPYMATAVAPYHTSPPDEPLHSPATSLADRAPEMSPPLSTRPRELPSSHPSRRNSLWLDSQRHDSASSQRSLPSLSDMFDGRPPPSINGAAGGPGDVINGYGPFHRSSRTSNGSPGPPPSLVGGDSRPPSLHKNYSSACSTSSSLSYPRTPMEGPLPIHALLQGKSPVDTLPPSSSSGPLLNGHANSPESKGPSMSHHLLSNGELAPNSVLANGTGACVHNPLFLPLSPPPGKGVFRPELRIMLMFPSQNKGYFASPPPITTPPSSHQHTMVNGLGVKPSLKRRAPSDSEGTNLDGLGALLRAGEMVDRLPR